MSAHRPIILANWKANLPPGEEVALAGEIAGALAGVDRVEVVIAPSALGLVPVASLLRREHGQLEIAIAAQDCSAEGAGAHTGELPVEHLVGIASSVIVGHSERRRERGESDVTIGRKVARVARAGLRPILCLGDDVRGDDAMGRDALIAAQWEGALAGAGELGADLVSLLSAGLIIAYEPVWAIGSGVPATSEEARRVARALRATIGADLPILYGGSVDAAATAGLLVREEAEHHARLDGLLVGGASLDAANFAAIVAAAARR